ncbi:metallophosphoesterase [Faecalimonas umbilicata]|nr:metallophosphoesterase [Faecalimonas umbilicata]
MILTLYEPFRYWLETGSVYILSDSHFGDPDCKLMDPGWIEPEEQVDRINNLIVENDTFVCLGDVGDAFYVKQLKARKKILLLGNHDKKKDYKGLFDEIYDGPLMIAEKILLSHEPVYGLPWCLNIHGHDHSGIEPYEEGCKHLNLAANVCDYMLVSLGKLIKGGILSNITSIHRITIDRATEKKDKWRSEEKSVNDVLNDKNGVLI